MDLKPGVLWSGMDPAMWYARGVAGALHRELTGKEGTITSGRRTASPGGSSLHPLGLALDIRVWAFETKEAVREFAAELSRRLGPDFDVIVEGPAATNPRYRNRPPHIHVEYDPKEWAGA